MQGQAAADAAKASALQMSSGAAPAWHLLTPAGRPPARPAAIPRSEGGLEGVSFRFVPDPHQVERALEVRPHRLHAPAAGETGAACRPSNAGEQRAFEPPGLLTSLPHPAPSPASCTSTRACRWTASRECRCSRWELAWIELEC